MSISATRKVGSSTSSPRTERGYSANGKDSQFIEHIDTQNNVLVRDDNTEHHQQSSYYTPEQQDEKENNNFSPSRAYVHNSINAIAASGVLDNYIENNHNTHKVGVYDNNQSIIKDEELERTGRNYLKHFYEKNEHLIDVDKLI